MLASTDIWPLMTGSTRNLLRFFMIVLALAGMVVSTLATYEHFLIEHGNDAGLELSASFCKVNEALNCRAVIGSSFSKLFGIPLSYYGFLFYGAILVGAIAAFNEGVVSPVVAGGAFLIAGVFGLVLSIVLFLISEFGLGVLCPICLSTYAVNFLFFLAAYWYDKTTPLVARFTEGAGAILSFPGMLFGTRGTTAGRTISWLTVVFLLALAMQLITLPDFLLVKFIGPEIQRSQIDKQKGAVVARWEAAATDVLPVDPRGGIDGDFAHGDPNAPIKIVEFSDFQCPACRGVFHELEPVLAKLGDKVFFVYKNYPLDQACNAGIDQEFHQNACLAAEMARCLGEQGKFWQGAELLFTTPTLESKEPRAVVQSQLIKESAVLSIDGQALASCLESGRQRKKIQDDIAAANKLGVDGTPSFWINGKRVQAPAPVVLREIFEKILAREPHHPGAQPS